MVIIVDCDLVEGVIHVKVLGAVFDMEKFLGTFVGGHDFGFEGALCGLGLDEWRARRWDRRSSPEEFESGTVRDGSD